MANIDIGFAQHCPYAADHPRLVGIAAEENIALGDKFSPIATYADNTGFPLHHCSAQKLHVFIAGAWLACKG